MKYIFLLSFSFFISILNINAQLNMELIGHLEYEETLSDIWGYVDDNGTEYAIVGVRNGVSVVSLATPTAPQEVAFIEGPLSIWRDIKTWEKTAYVSNENGEGLLVMDLSELPDTVYSYNWQPSVETEVFGTIVTDTLEDIHNLYVDEFGVLYICGSNFNDGGLVFVDVSNDPNSPELIGFGNNVYSHDVYVRNNLAYSSEIYVGEFAVYDISDKLNVTKLGSNGTQLDFTHNAWLSDDSNYLFTTDEKPNGTIGSYDVSDPSDIKELDQFVPFEILNKGVVPHNVHVWNDYIIASYYKYGTTILDGSKPDNLVEVGNFDSLLPLPEGENYLGVWGAYPFLPSQNVIISDRSTGLFVLAPNYQRACWLEGQVTDASTGQPLMNAQISIEDTNIFTESAFGGDFKTGYALSGEYDINIYLPFYKPQTIENVSLVNGEITNLNIALEPLESFSVNGSVVLKSNGTKVPNAKIFLDSDAYDFLIEADENGEFSINEFYANTYKTACSEWGLKAKNLINTSFNQENFIIELEEGYEDAFYFDKEWNVEGDAESANWIRVNPPVPTPLMSQQPANDVTYYYTPTFDVEADVQNACFVTGQETENNGLNFNQLETNEKTILSSPVMDLTSLEDPIISFYYWFINIASFNGIEINNYNVAEFPMLLTISNGAEDFNMFLGSDYDWRYFEIQIKELLEITDQMTVTLEIDLSKAANESPDGINAEAAIDFFRVYDGAITPETSLSELSNVSMEINPNISAQYFNLDYQLNTQQYSRTVLAIYDITGKFISSYSLNEKIGTLRFGEHLSQGIYFAQIVNGFEKSKAVKIIKQ